MARPVPNDAASLNILQSIEGLIEHANQKMDSVCLSITNIEHGINNMLHAELQKQTALLTELVTKLASGNSSEGLHGGKVDTNYESEHIGGLDELSKRLDKISDNTNQKGMWDFLMPDIIERRRQSKFNRVYMYSKKTGWAAHTKRLESVLDQILTEIRNGNLQPKSAKGGGGEPNITMTTGKAVKTIFEGMSKYLKSANKIKNSKKVLEVTDALIGSLEKIGKKAKSIERSGKALKELGIGLLVFGTTVTLATPFLITAIPGIYAAKLMIKILISALGDELGNKRLKKMKKGARGLGDIGKELLVFGVTMALATIPLLLAIPGILVAGLAIKVLVWAFSALGRNSKRIRRGTRALSKITRSIASMILILAVASVAAPLLLSGLATVAMLVGGIAIAFALVGLLAKFIDKGSGAMIFAMIPILLLSGAMAIWKMAKVTWEDIGMLGATVAMVGVEMGLAGLGALFILAGAVAMLIASIAVIAMSFALKIFKSVEWSEKENDILANTITGVLAALRGETSDGEADNSSGIFGVILSLMNSAAIIIGSLAIIILSVALASFKAVSWSEEDNTILGDTISGVLAALGQSQGGDNVSPMGEILHTMLALLSAGILFIAGAAILVFSLALKAFKAVGWTEEDKTILGDSIAGVLQVLGQGAGGKDSSPGESLLMTLLALFSAGILFVASGAVYVFGLALGAFKDVGWTDKDTETLGNSISGVLRVLGNPGGGDGTSPGMGILELIMALLSAGTIFIVSGAVYLFAEALGRFKAANWTSADNKHLKNAIMGVTAVIDSLEDLDMEDDVLDILEDISEPIGDFGDALKKFKDAGFTADDPYILGNSIKRILGAFHGVTYKQLDMMEIFTGHIVDLTDYVDEIDQLADSFERIADSMESVKNSINGTELEKLTQYRDVLFHLGNVIDSTSDNTSQGIVEGINDTLGGLFSKFFPTAPAEDTSSTSATIDAIDKSESNLPVPTPGTPGEGMDNSQILAALNKLSQEIQSVDSALRGVIVVENKNNPFG